MISLPPSSLLAALKRSAMFACTALVFAAPLSARPERIKLATLAPSGTSFHHILLEMGQKWKAAPDGGVNLVIFPDGRMGGEGDMVRRMRLGQLQAGLLTALGMVEIDYNVAGLQNIPMAFRSLDEATYVRDKLAPQLDKEIEEKGFIVLGWCDTGWWRIFSKKPLHEPADIPGEKLNIGVNNPGMAEVIRPLGLQPVELDPTNILVGLQTGLITITPSPPIYALAGQFYQPAPYMLELNWAPLVGSIVMTTKAWKALTPAQQEIVRTTAAEACARITTTARMEMAESVAAMEKHGLKVQTVTGDREQRWIDFFEKMQKAARGTMVPAPMFDEIMRTIAEYRARNKATAP